MQQQQIITSLQACQSWEEKLRFIIALGKSLPSLSLSERECAQQVVGCENTIWLTWQFDNNQLKIQVDSDARVVKGLLALLLAPLEGLSAKEIVAFNFDAYLERLALTRSLSLSKINGMKAVMQQIKNIASSLL
ncbi:MAG: SufE family protein [Vibrionaceae bacterium]